MSRLKLNNAFRGTTHVILPVIHSDADGANIARNIQRAKNAGADGVWLVSHSDYRSQWSFAGHVEEHVRANPNFWIGVNFLGWEAVKAVRIALELGAKGVWVDDAQIDERVGVSAQAEAQDVVKELRDEILYFGGVAFKYQRKVQELEKAADIASCFMDVVTTSGSGTGKAADLEKIKRIRNGMGTFPLAVASGLTPENVSEYLPHVDVLMVATGVAQSHEELYLEKLRAFVDQVRSFSAQG